MENIDKLICNIPYMNMGTFGITNSKFLELKIKNLKSFGILKRIHGIMTSS